MTTNIDFSELDALGEMPGMLKEVWPTVEELKADLTVAIENHLISDSLMAKMLTPMSSSEAEKVKAEIQAITQKMNDMFSKRFVGKDKITAYLVMLDFGKLMHRYTPQDARSLTQEQAAMLRETGALRELLRDSRQV